MAPVTSDEKIKQVEASLLENNIKILVVEDEAIIAMDIQSMLSRMGYVDSEVVFSGEESIEKVAARRPHLVLMDIKLKGHINGLEAAKQIYHEYRVPVVYITAFGDESTIQKAEGPDRSGFITKPFEEVELQNTIQQALNKKLN